MAPKHSNETIVTLPIQLQPNASKNEIVGYHGEYLKIRINAPATKDKANKALIKFLADYFNVPKSHVEICQGLHSRYKVLLIKDSKHPSPFV